MPNLDERLSQLRAEATRRETNARQSRVERMRDDMGRTGRFLAQLLLAIGWIWSKVLRPTLGWIKKPTKYLWREYRKLWSLAVYRQDRFGDLIFSKTRAGLMVLATWFFVFYIFWPLVGFTWDGVLYALTVEHEEHIYLLGSQEIDSKEGDHNIEGCSHLPCSDTDALYFRTTGGLFNNIWYLTHHGSLFYPEYVAAAVPYSLSSCVVTSYGLRLRLLYRWINTYSTILAVKCDVVNDERAKSPPKGGS